MPLSDCHCVPLSSPTVLGRTEQIFQPSLALICVAYLGQVAGELVSMLSAVIKMLLEGPMPMGEDLEGWESVAFHCKTLETTANDLVAGGAHCST